MIYKFNWESIYPKIIAMTSLALNGERLIQGKDFRIAGISHTNDHRIIVDCEGILNFVGHRHVIYRLEEKNGGLTIVCEGSEEGTNVWSPFPEQIKVGDKVYTLQRGQPVHKPNGNTELGSLDAEGQTLFVSNAGSKNTERLIMLHELTHAIIDRFCSNISLELNEAFTYGFSKGLYEVICDNPGIFSDIKQEYEPAELEIIECEDWFSRGEEHESEESMP